MSRKEHQQARQLNNGGFSLVELLVIVAIMGVLIGMFSISYVIVEKGNVKKAIGYIDDALTLCKEKAQTNSADEWKVIIEEEKVSVVKVEGSSEQYISQKELPKNVDLYVTELDGKLSGTEVGSDYDSVSISFGRMGEVKDVYITSSGTSIKGTSPYFYIIARYKDKKQQNIKIYYSTGKHIVE